MISVAAIGNDSSLVFSVFFLKTYKINAINNNKCNKLIFVSSLSESGIPMYSTKFKKMPLMKVPGWNKLQEKHLKSSNSSCSKSVSTASSVQSEEEKKVPTKRHKPKKSAKLKVAQPKLQVLNL